VCSSDLQGSEGIFVFPQFIQMMEQYIGQGTTATFQISCNSTFTNRLTIITTQSGGKRQRQWQDTEIWQLKIL
jgi:hypothetical protein